MCLYICKDFGKKNIRPSCKVNIFAKNVFPDSFFLCQEKSLISHAGSHFDLEHYKLLLNCQTVLAKEEHQSKHFSTLALYEELEPLLGSVSPLGNPCF